MTYNVFGGMLNLTQLTILTMIRLNTAHFSAPTVTDLQRINDSLLMFLDRVV